MTHQSHGQQIGQDTHRSAEVEQFGHYLLCPFRRRGCLPPLHTLIGATKLIPWEQQRRLLLRGYDIWQRSASSDRGVDVIKHYLGLYHRASQRLGARNLVPHDR